MILLTRTVRLCVNPPGKAAAAGEGVNGFGGKPAMRGLGRYYELDIICAGEPDPATGYLISIKEIDHAVRSAALPILQRVCAERPETEPATLLPDLLRAVDDDLGGLVRQLTWALTPTYRVTMNADDQSAVLLRQRFDIAAAHRLHVPSLSDDENRQLFGRCNNPAGHGHNYVFEPVVRAALDHAGAALSLADLERLVDERIIDAFDHTHLNEDTDVFATGAGLNPSVENIAKVFFERLAPAVADASAGRAELRSMTVWETDRTCATFEAPAGEPPRGG
jgi:6-pyruvoyltetrahydropterin/6-carboxytetrahydropterin synthase